MDTLIPKMRVLHVIESMGHGGAEWLVVEHVRHAGPGVQSLVCALNRGGPALDAAATYGARTFVLDKGNRRISGLRRLARLMHDERVTVVNGHEATGSLYGTLAAVRAGVRPVFRTEHLVHYPGRHSRVYPLLEAWTTRRTRRIICVCEAVRKTHARRFPWATRRFVSVLNGISPAGHTRPREEVRAELDLQPHHQVVLTVGRLVPAKAQYLLLESFVEIFRGNPQARLVIVGEGPLRGNLEQGVRQLGLAGHVLLLGGRTDVADLMIAADLFALASVLEGLPVTVLEAMRAGLPVVATDAGGTGEAVLHGQTGLLVPVGDREALTLATARLLSDRALAATLGTAARRRWAEHFVAERMVRQTEALYHAELAREREAVELRASMDRQHEYP